jgi:hypothetical protein
MMKNTLHILTFVLASALLAGNARAQFSIRSSLDGSQAGTAAIGTGTAFGTFSSDFKTLTYQITVANLTGPITGAHFHFGPTGGVITAITFTGNTANGTWTNIPDTLLQYFFSGTGIYVNVHTAAHPAGEIRGGVNPTQFFFQANLNGAQAGTSSTAIGTGYFRFKDTTGGGVINSLKYSITFAGLSSAYSGAHFHYAPNGAVLEPITFADSSANGEWTGFPDSVLTLLLHGMIYVNVHSSSFPGGEIRGTVTPVGTMPFVAALDSTQSGTSSAGTGTAYAMLSSNMQSISYGATYAQLSGALTGSHFHTSVGGGVIHPVTFTGNSTTGTWTGFSDVNLQDLLRGRVYMNLHTASNPAGEIGGIFKYYDGVFTTMLNGAQAGTASTGTGTAWIHFGGQSDSGVFRVTFAGLAGTYSGSHFHLAPGGGVIEPITATDSTGAGTWGVPDSLVASMLEGNVYVNVHSSTFPAGDIRGTLTATYGSVTSVRQVSQEVPSAFSLEQNYPNPFNPSTKIAFSITKASRLTLKVYNLLGQEVATLMDGQLNAGSYSVTFDAGKLASGLYLYRLSTNSGIVAVRKMLLLK